MKKAIFLDVFVVFQKNKNQKKTRSPSNVDQEKRKRLFFSMFLWILGKRKKPFFPMFLCTSEKHLKSNAFCHKPPNVHQPSPYNHCFIIYQTFSKTKSSEWRNNIRIHVLFAVPQIYACIPHKPPYERAITLLNIYKR